MLLVGCATGIGAAGARRISAAGAALVLVDRDADGVTSLAEELGCEARVVDVRDVGELRQVVEFAADTLGGLDCVWSNAGVQLGGSLTDALATDLDLSYELNVRAHFVLAQASLPFLQRSSGAFLLTASNSGLQAENDLLPYTVTKAASIALVKQMAHDHARQGVRFNALCPGYVDTPFNEAIWATMGGREAFTERLGATIPAGRMSSADEIAAIACWLLSDAASFVNGHALVADGAELVG